MTTVLFDESIATPSAESGRGVPICTSHGVLEADPTMNRADHTIISIVTAYMVVRLVVRLFYSTFAA